ncbi:hypothetical protein N7462_005123 [Penicillium macrosclerotiorum]|uniref:uncharacterized protein n=1 Tax=Penicillium macrosclerotiorum TaxID=303699 RepID=UPI002548041F|nr:uncharacterized protein N7462_005123 [Penicillium macrosclerotiorum]KAJ5690731.1 hypothetical protein N7462_005123 [Penicillium macrosclerotiorum]
MGDEPWLDSLSDDWPSVPATPTTPGPSVAPSPRPSVSVQSSPSRIPVPARRSVEQQSPADLKKVTRPCHFIKREPPTPKTPRTPKTPSKPRSPTPAKSKTNTPKPASSPKPTPTSKSSKSAKPPKRGSPKPTPGVMAAARKLPQGDTRSPLRSVSNVSSQTSYQSEGTVQIKPKKDTGEGSTTPEWRKRLVRGEIPAEDQRDLFAPMGLESVFKPPSPSTQQDSIPFSKQDDQPWDFTDATSRPASALRGDQEQTDAQGEEPERAQDEYSDTGMESPLGTVNRPLWTEKQHRDEEFDPEAHSQDGGTDVRTASGLEDLRNEGITPITFTRPNTLEGGATSEVIKSALKQVTNKLESLSVDQDSRPDSPASDSFLFYNQHQTLHYNHSDPPPDGSPRGEDSLLDVTSHSLPQDLSMGTIDFSRRGPSRSFLKRFSPSPFPSYRKSPANLANNKIRNSPLFSRSQSNGSPPLPRPSSSHVRPSTSGDAESKQGTMPSSGSPLKLFGEHDTFTNNRLLRRMSQFEETFEDGSDHDEPPSPSEEARRKGENRSFLNVRHEPLSEISSRLNERLASRNVQRPRLNRFGDGELDKFDFSDASPYERQLVYDEVQGFGSRPSSRKFSSSRQQYLRRGSQQDSLRYARSSSSGFTRKPSAWTRQSYFDHMRDGTWSSRVHRKENVGFPETKRVPKAPGMDPTPKRRRTILRDESAEPDHPHANSDSLQNLLENGDYLAPPGVSQSMLRPRTPTPSQIRSIHGSKILSRRDYSESNFDERDYSDSFSIEGDVPLVMITGTSDSSRKGSITTQDYLNEATKIMDLIRAKGRTAPGSGLASVQESDPDSDEGDLSYEDESTREAFSRPPSREGTTDLRKQREPKELNPQILSYLKKYQEKDDLEFGANESVMSLNINSSGRQSNAEGLLKPDPERTGGLAPEERKRKPSGPIDDIAESIAHDLMTINTQMSGFSIQSIPTGSSQNSQAKGMLSSDLVSHLIPEQVNGFVYDRSKNQWVKGDADQPVRKPLHQDDTDDPFQDIPDLSVDELQEMMRTHGPNSPVKVTAADANRYQNTPPPQGAGTSPAKANPRPHTRDGERSTNASSVHSRTTRFTSSVPNSGTRATSWGTEETRETNEAGNRLPTPGTPAMAGQPRIKKSRVATITFSSPLVSHVAYREDPDASEPQLDTENPTTDDPSCEGVQNQRSSASPSRRETSIGGQPFVRRPVSRIDERNEEGTEDLSLIQRDKSLALQQTLNGNAAEQSLIPLRSDEQETNYSFHLSPLPEFSVNQPDHPLNLEMSYVAQRTHPTSLRQVHGTFALATEDMIKHITDVEPYEPYWEHVRRLVLRQKGLITLHKLSDFCPRLEDLDVSDNDIGQLSGVPAGLRTLKIPRNCLSNLTSWSHLTNLQYLDISGNDIESLDGFSSLIHLRELKANDNQIRNIDGVLDLNGLLSLKLSNNSLTAIDFEGTELTRLRDLDLSHNCLSSVRNVDWLPSLATLDLSANQIPQFESSGSLISLRALKLSGNCLETLDLKHFSSVNLLYLDQNYLSTITGLEHCHNMEVLSVREQSPATENDPNFALDIDLGHVKDIRKVFLSSNKLSRNCLSPSASLLRLQLLDIAACTLNALPNEFAARFPNLKVLNMNFNSVKELEPLVGMNCLARLTVAGNRLARMRRVCQILSRLGRNGSIPDRKKLKDQENAVVQQEEKDLSDALADLDRDERVTQTVTWDDSAKGDREIEVNDPFTLPPADPRADERYLNHLDRATRLRRRVLELLLYAGTSGSLHMLDGLELQPSLGENSPDMGHAWAKLEELGVLRRKAITDKT